MATQMFNSTVLQAYDKKAVLWKKINQILSQQNGDAHPPKPNDWPYNSIFKVAQILSER